VVALMRPLPSQKDFGGVVLWTPLVYLLVVWFAKQNQVAEGSTFVIAHVFPIPISGPRVVDMSYLIIDVWLAIIEDNNGTLARRVIAMSARQHCQGGSCRF
jgi:hypothetical protein